MRNVRKIAIVKNARRSEPAIIEIVAHILQVRIAHVLDREDETVLVLIETFPHIGEELQCEFLALLVDFRQMDDLRALGFRHLV